MNDQEKLAVFDAMREALVGLLLHHRRDAYPKSDGWWVTDYAFDSEWKATFEVLESMGMLERKGEGAGALVRIVQKDGGGA